MNEVIRMGLVGMVGLLLGAVFFGGLWWTVRNGVSSRRSALWFLGSLILRTGIVLAGFYWVSDGRWERLIACLFGFIGARFVVTGLTRLPRADKIPPAKELRRAS